MNIGVIIGRFQIDDLHKGHQALFSLVYKNHSRVLVLLGVPPLVGQKRNPLDYQLREQMIKEKYPDALVCPLPDQQTSERWSANIDRLLQTIYPNASSVTIYGGRDSSAIKAYCGKWKVKDATKDMPAIWINQEKIRSASDRRAQIKEDPIPGANFRAGVIYATEHLYPTAKMAVDMALVKTDEAGNKWVLMGRKDGEIDWRFPGGMVDPDDESLEMAAMRELSEETHLGSEGKPVYLGSFNVADWRVRDAEEWAIFTALFYIPYTFGAAQAGDDLKEVHWWMIGASGLNVIKNHQPLMDRLVQYLGEKK